MKKPFGGPQQWTRRFHNTTRLASSKPPTLTPSPLDHTSLPAFRKYALVPKQPFLFRRDTGSPTITLPAAKKWFTEVGGDGSMTKSSWSLAPYMIQFEKDFFPYELVLQTPEKQQAWVAFRTWLSSSQNELEQLLAKILGTSLDEVDRHMFFQIYAPLLLLVKALDWNRQHVSDPSRLLELYIAQSSLTDLCQPLLEDLPTPELVLKAGQGDVYNSSIWLGTEPTYTPLHRDPNPNIFSQLCNYKRIRLMPPAAGDRLFYQVQTRIRQQGNSRIRGPAMMEGKEREVLHDVVWEAESFPDGLVEAELGPGDALFIPNGWWHSVKSKGSSGELNGSVNWWFR